MSTKGKTEPSGTGLPAPKGVYASARRLVEPLVIKYEKFIKFCLIGLLNTVLNIIIYNALMHLGLHYIPAYAVGFILTWLNAFRLNAKHVFKSSGKRAMVKYFALYMSSLLLGNWLLFLLVDVAGMNKTLAQFPVIAVTMTVNYTGSKFWVFK